MNRFSLTLALAALLSPGVAAQTQTPASPAPKAASLASPHNPLSDFPQFSAIMSGGPFRQQEMDIARSGNVLRIGSPEYHYITDLAQTMTWTIAAGHCTKLPVSPVWAFPFLPFKKFDVKLVATHDPETIDGHSCKVETLSFQPKSGDPGFEMKVWHADDLKGFPIRIDWHNLFTNRTSTYKFTEVKLQPPDSKLFARPADCKGRKGGAFVDTGNAKPATSKPAANPAPPPDKPAPVPPQ